MGEGMKRVMSVVVALLLALGGAMAQEGGAARREKRSGKGEERFLAALGMTDTAAGVAQAQAAPAQSAAKALEGFDEYVAQLMKEWKVPGLAIGVVQGDTVILSKGYGQRDVKNNLSVTPQTIFAIGSITKSFTVTTLGMLVDDGKLDWDKPVREYLTGFRLHDEAATDRLTPRDMVTHRSGLPRHDALWYNSPFTRVQMVERLRYLEPSKDLRQTYQYNNLMFMTAGYLAGQLAATTWEDLMAQRVFVPLGMKSTNTSVQASQKSVDFAKPYMKAKEEIVEVPFRVIDNVGPAGSINSNIEDMTQYLKLHMNQGKWDGKQLLSASNAGQMQMPQMVIQGPLRWPELGHTAYGMAWTVGAYRGKKMVGHGGAIDGFVAQLTFLPQEKIGVVVLANRGGQPLPTIVTYNLLDRLLGAEQAPWSQRLMDDQKRQEASQEEAKKKGFTQKRPNTRTSHELAEYAGEYENAGYGVAKVEMDGGELRMTFNRITAPLRHFHYDTFETPEDPLNPLEREKVSFTTNMKGDIESLSVLLEPNVKPIVFTRRADAAMRTKQFLEPLTGQYQLGPQTVAIQLRGEDTLLLVLPGQPTRELIPARGMTFDVQGLAGFSVEFKKDATGAVTEIVFYQPNGTFAGKRR